MSEQAASVSPLLQDAGATVLLSLQPEVPVLSEEYWDNCVLTRFPSREAMTVLYDSAEWRRALPARREALENSVTVATTGLSLPG